MTPAPFDRNLALPARGPTAPLRNVILFTELMEHMLNRGPGSSPFGVFYGFAGLGKTVSAVFAATRYEATYIECGDSWSKGTLVDALLFEMTGMTFRETIPAKAQRIIRLLSQDPRPIIVDEADHLVKKSTIDMVREIADKSGAAIILIGEEELPVKLWAFARAYSRVYRWVAAEPCDAGDCRKLAALYAPGVEIAAPLLDHVLKKTSGVSRLIYNNLKKIAEFAAERGLKRVDLADWSTERIDDGNPRARRAPRARPDLARAS